MIITALYAAPLALVFLWLSKNVIAGRRSGKVSIGHGDDRNLERRIRAHANFAEYVPFTLLLMALAENLSAPALALHAAGICLLVGRINHAIALSGEGSPPLRISGMVLTFAALAIAAVACGWLALQGVLSGA